MNVFRRAVVLLLCVVGAVMMAPATAQAASTGGCSLTKTVPGSDDISYYYCDTVSPTKHKWISHVDVSNTHDPGLFAETQVNLRTDGKDNILEPQRWVLGLSSNDILDPYNVSLTPTYHSCTKGHTYFPIVRMRVENPEWSAWGAWAGAGQFVC